MLYRNRKIGELADLPFTNSRTACVAELIKITSKVTWTTESDRREAYFILRKQKVWLMQCIVSGIIGVGFSKVGQQLVSMIGSL